MVSNGICVVICELTLGMFTYPIMACYGMVSNGVTLLCAFVSVFVTLTAGAYEGGFCLALLSVAAYEAPVWPC